MAIRRFSCSWEPCSLCPPLLPPIAPANSLQRDSSSRHCFPLSCFRGSCCRDCCCFWPSRLAFCENAQHRRAAHFVCKLKKKTRTKKGMREKTNRKRKRNGKKGNKKERGNNWGKGVKSKVIRQLTAFILAARIDDRVYLHPTPIISVPLKSTTKCEMLATQSVNQINSLHEQYTRHGKRGHWRHDGLAAVR